MVLAGVSRVYNRCVDQINSSSSSSSSSSNASNHITEQNTGALAPLLVADIYWSTTEDSSNNCELPMKVRYNLYNANK